jgi:hypothetical protein
MKFWKGLFANESFFRVSYTIDIIPIKKIIAMPEWARAGGKTLKRQGELYEICS